MKDNHSYGFEGVVLQLFPDPSIFRHRYILYYPPGHPIWRASVSLQKNPLYEPPAATKHNGGVVDPRPRPLASLDARPRHASRYFSGALRWKSISFAKQSGRLPQHRGVMESDGCPPPYREARGQSIITPPVNIAASITYSCRSLKAPRCCT